MALSTGIIPEFVKIIVRSTEQVTTSHIVTSSDLSRNIFLFRRDFIHQLELHNPDIVHIHAAWDFRAAIAERVARSHGFFTVVSPHGGLSPENMEINFWKDRLPKIILYQINMIRHCNMLVATSRKELQDLERLNWKRNIMLIPHPLTNEIGDEDTRALIMAAYRKVIDTQYRQRLTAEEEELVCQCLKASVLPPNGQTGAPTEIDITGNISYRRIFLYIFDQNVTKEFIAGAHALEINIPPTLDVPSIPRFHVKQKKESKKLRHIRTIASILSELTSVTHEEIKAPDLKAYLTIYEMIRCHDYDEDEFVKQINKFGIKRFTRELMKQLNIMFKLEVGYMPVLPKG